MYFTITALKDNYGGYDNKLSVLFFCDKQSTTQPCVRSLSPTNVGQVRPTCAGKTCSSCAQPAPLRSTCKLNNLCAVSGVVFFVFVCSSSPTCPLIQSGIKILKFIHNRYPTVVFEFEYLLQDYWREYVFRATHHSFSLFLFSVASC